MKTRTFEMPWHIRKKKKKKKPLSPPLLSKNEGATWKERACAQSRVAIDFLSKFRSMTRKSAKIHKLCYVPSFLENPLFSISHTSMLEIARISIHFTKFFIFLKKILSNVINYVIVDTLLFLFFFLDNYNSFIK